MRMRKIIVAQDVTQSAVDYGQLVPLVEAIEINLGRKPEQSADSGSETNLEALESRHVDAYVATGRAKDAVAGAAKGEAAAKGANATILPAHHRRSYACRGHERSRPVVTTAPTGCVSSSPSRCSGRSSRGAASASS
jgi:hypothetical protein